MIYELIFGIGVSAFLLIYLIFKWNPKEHYVLHLFTAVFVILLVVLIPKAILDYPDNCTWQLNQSIETGINSTGSPVPVANAYNITTTNTYSYFCETNTHTTHRTFYVTIMWYLRLFWAYLCLYYLYVIFLKKKLVDWNVIKRRR